MRMHVICTLVLLGSSTVIRAENAKIDAVMKPWTGKTTPGCAVAVVQNGKVSHAKGYGMADLERGVAITPETVFDIASTSKQFTAATILMLAAAGKLKLDDPIRTHLPELPQLTKGTVTIRHLLHHTGGLRDYTALLQLGGTRTEDVATTKEALVALARQKAADFEPGSQYAYSNTGYFLLSQIAERAGKRPLTEQVRDTIFTPLAMTRSQILDDHTKIIPGRAVAYGPNEAGWKLETSQWEQTGDGAVQTTVLDLAKWDRNFYDPKVGGAALVTALQERGKTSDGKELDYAAGLMLGNYRGQPFVAHSGAWAGYRSQLVRFPAHKTSVIVLCNVGSANPVMLARSIADVVLEKQLAPVPKPAAAAEAGTAAVTLTTAELDAWVGSYRGSKSDKLVTVKRDGDKLAVEAMGETYPLVPQTKSQFRIAVTPIIVEFAGAKPKRTILAKGPPDEHYVEVVPYKATATELAGFAGRFWSAELQTMWTLRVAGDTVIIDGRGLDAGKLEATAKDEIGSSKEGISLKLVRTARGVTGFTCDGGGVHGIRFERLP